MRYFCAVGSVLVVLLLAANRLFPDGDRQPANSGVEDYGIRIRSVAKPPEPVTFDTSQPTIVPPQSPVTVAAQPRLDALALIVSTRPPDAGRNRQAETKRKPSKNRPSKVVVTRSPAPTRIASVMQVAERPVASVSLLEVIRERLGQGLFKLN
jgi:hypothetical protein